MNQGPVIVFVCEHGAAKSILAATYFNHLAGEMGLKTRAVARGTNPAKEVSPQTVTGLSADGLAPSEWVPQGLTASDLQSAQWVIAFCELPAEYHQQARIEHWKKIPAVSENYEQARDVILEHIRQMLER
jgi:protein-tyrosine-phosphatase